jgi:transposase
MSKHPPQQYRLLNNPSFVADMKNPSITLRDIALKYGASYPTVWKVGHKYNLTAGRVPGGTERKLDEETIEKIKNLTLEGKDVQSICKLLDIAPATVSRFRREFGLTKAYKKRGYKRDWNNADEKSVPCSRIALIRASNFAAAHGKDLKTLVDAAINQYIDSQTV